jgi:hypothetical protein
MPLVVTPSARFRVRLGSVLSIAGVPPNSPDMGLVWIVKDRINSIGVVSWNAVCDVADFVPLGP